MAGRWQSAPNLLSPRSALAACALNGLYAVGGLDLNGATPRTEQLRCIAETCWKKSIAEFVTESVTAPTRSTMEQLN